MALHPQAERYLRMLAEMDPGPGFVRPRADDVEQVQQMRAATRGFAAFAQRLELPDVRDLTLPGPGGPIPARLYRPGGGRLPGLVYFHGGGWVIGDLDGVDPLCRRLAAEVGCAVLSVDYRLAPEHPFPAAVDDAWAATAELAAHPGRYGVDAAALAVAGDSAGATLAAVTALRARDEGLPLAHQLLACPATDTAMDTGSYARYGDGYALQAETMAWSLEMYAAGADRADPRLAPLRAPRLAGAAPATVLTAEYDALRDEGEAYAERLTAAAVPVELRRYAGMVHSFLLMPELFDAATEARMWAGERLRAAFARVGEGEGVASLREMRAPSVPPAADRDQ